jgi:hypothetical protein
MRMRVLMFRAMIVRSVRNVKDRFASSRPGEGVDGRIKSGYDEVGLRAFVLFAPMSLSKQKFFASPRAQRFFQKRSSFLLSFAFRLGVVFGGVCLWFAADTAQANLIEEFFPSDIPGYQPDFSASVASRMEQQDLSDGVELGDFVIRPDLTESAGYDSNTLGQAKSGSAEIDTNATLQANSDWARNALNVSLNVDNQRYLNVPAASLTNWSASAGGSVSLGNDTATIGYSHLALNLAATSLGAFGVATPVPYTVDDLRASYLKLFGRFSLTPKVEFENYQFGQSGGQDPVSYKALSHRVELAGLTGRFESAPGDAVVVILQPSFAQFSEIPASNYSDIAGFVGLDAQGPRIIQYRALLGFEHRSFADHVTPAVTTPTFQFEAIWTPTEIDTVTATAEHELDDPTSPFARDDDVLDGRVELDHELRQNVFLVGYAAGSRSIARLSIADAGSVRQSQLSAGASAVWNLSRHVSFTTSYGYALNETTGSTAADASIVSTANNFSSNSILIGLRLDD